MFRPGRTRNSPAPSKQRGAPLGNKRKGGIYLRKGLWKPGSAPPPTHSTTTRVVVEMSWGGYINVVDTRSILLWQLLELPLFGKGLHAYPTTPCYLAKRPPAPNKSEGGGVQPLSQRERGRWGCVAGPWSGCFTSCLRQAEFKNKSNDFFLLGRHNYVGSRGLRSAALSLWPVSQALPLLCRGETL